MIFDKYQKRGAYHWKFYAQPGNKYRAHVDRIQHWVTNKSVLDVGAGDGLITAKLSENGIVTIGIDNEPLAVQLAQEKGANVILGDAYQIPFPNDTFEAVLMADALEHFQRPVDALREAHRVLRQALYISTPPKRDDGKLTDKFHYQEWTPTELQALVESVGFRMAHQVVSYPEEKIMYAAVH